MYLNFICLQVIYLQDYAEKFGLNIRYNSEIVSIAREEEDGADMFILKDRNETLYRCEILVMRYYSESLMQLQVFYFLSTGLWVPNVPENFPGIELAEVRIIRSIPDIT